MAPLSVVPPSGHVSTLAHPSKTSTGAPSAPIIHDSMRYGLPSTASNLNVSHPLEARLQYWDKHQEDMKMELIRRNFGLCEVVRRGMEIQLAGSDFKPQCLGGPSNLHLEILRGTDASCTWEDVYKGNGFEAPSFHEEMEARLKMKW